MLSKTVPFLFFPYFILFRALSISWYVKSFVHLSLAVVPTQDRWLNSTPGVPDSVDLGGAWESSFLTILNNADTAGPRVTLWKTLPFQAPAPQK